MFNYKDQTRNLLKLNNFTSYNDNYDPLLLKAIPRSLNRNLLGIREKMELPFHGADIWTLYEVSWLKNTGLPQIGIGEAIIDATSMNFIESKSFKLYLNSLNQTCFSSIEDIQLKLLQDISYYVDGKVIIKLYTIENFIGKSLLNLKGKCIDNQSIRINSYTFSNHWLKDAASGSLVNKTLVSHLLKSNCLITGQPDWGSIQISYQGIEINEEALLRYIISFRQHNEFHEQCVERIFCDIMNFCNPEKLSVYARYTRRGGLDINPWRSNTQFIPLTERLVRQ